MISCEPCTGMERWNTVISPPKHNDTNLYISRWLILFHLTQILFGTKLTCLKEIHRIVGRPWGIRNSNRSDWQLKKLNGTREFLKGGTRVIFWRMIECLLADMSTNLNVMSKLLIALGILVDSEIVLSTRYGKTRVFINKNLINRDRLSTRPYQQRPVINKFDSW
jgi:hypothetical protein